jgi:hypothetical protein
VKHYTEEDLMLYYYDESTRRAEIEVHLDQCAACASTYRALADTLKLVATPETPERGDQYGLEVWQRIRHQLPEQEMPWWSVWFRADRLAIAGSVAVLLLAAFVAGRSWSSNDGSATPATVASRTTLKGTVNPGSPAADDPQQRILLTSIADHFDRSERVLTEIMNAPAGEDISAEQQWAADLVATSRLYRQDAADAGEPSVAAVLDELERSLLEVVHTPSRATAARLDEIRRRIDAASLLFKVRVLGDELRRREGQDAPRSRAVSAQVS